MAKGREGSNGHGRPSKRISGADANGSRQPKVNGRRATIALGGAIPRNGSNANPTNPMPKTHLSDSELQYFRVQLVEKRAELIGSVTTMESEALRKTRSEGSGDLSMMPIHMADIGTDNYEQEFTLGLVANERDMLRDIDAALARIENKTFGICEATHKPISKARLKIKPWARFCLEYKRSQEQQRRR